MSEKKSKPAKTKFFFEEKSAQSFAKKVSGEVKISSDGRWYVKYQATKGYQGNRPRQSYDEWWQESNLDGSFAYNGVTDDF
jgi:hypothetical protein